MLSPLFGLSQIVSGSIAVNDTTLDGNSFYTDLVYVETLDMWMLRTNEPGMRIIREIHAKNKQLVNDNKVLVADIFDCNNQVFILNKERNTFQRKYEFKSQQLDNTLESIKYKDILNKELQKKATVGKIMIPVAIGCVVIGIGGVLYGVLITQLK